MFCSLREGSSPCQAKTARGASRTLKRTLPSRRLRRRPPLGEGRWKNGPRTHATGRATVLMQRITTPPVRGITRVPHQKPIDRIRDQGRTSRGRSSPGRCARCSNESIPTADPGVSFRKAGRFFRRPVPARINRLSATGPPVTPPLIPALAPFSPRGLVSRSAGGTLFESQTVRNHRRLWCATAEGDRFNNPAGRAKKGLPGRDAGNQNPHPQTKPRRASDLIAQVDRRNPSSWRPPRNRRPA